MKASAPAAPEPPPFRRPRGGVYVAPSPSLLALFAGSLAWWAWAGAVVWGQTAEPEHVGAAQAHLALVAALGAAVLARRFGPFAGLACAGVAGALALGALALPGLFALAGKAFGPAVLAWSGGGVAASGFELPPGPLSAPAAGAVALCAALFSAQAVARHWFPEDDPRSAEGYSPFAARVALATALVGLLAATALLASGGADAGAGWRALAAAVVVAALASAALEACLASDCMDLPASALETSIPGANVILLALLCLNVSGDKALGLDLLPATLALMAAQFGNARMVAILPRARREFRPV